MANMKALRHRDRNQHFHREPIEYRDAVKRDVHACHVFILAGISVQGLPQYLAVVALPRSGTLAASGCGIRSGIPPSDLLGANVLRQNLPEFRLLEFSSTDSVARVILERLARERMWLHRLVS